MSDKASIAITVLLETESLSVKHEVMPTGTCERLHVHEKSQQVFCISKGEATFHVDGKIVTIKEHQSIHIQPMQQHFVVNNMSSDLELLVISQPSTKNDRTEL